jgi:hypothetical protein
MKSLARITFSILPPIIIILNLSLLISNIDSFHLRALNFHHHDHHYHHLRRPTSFTTFLNHDEEYARSTTTHNDKTKMMAKASTTTMTKSATALADDRNENLHSTDDYLVIDSLHVLDEDRPSLIETLKNPRDGLALLLLVPIAGTVSLCNIFGIYTEQLYTNLEIASIELGLLSGFVTFLQIATGYKIRKYSLDIDGTNCRRGLAEDSNVNLYAGTYSITVSWLALRESNACPNWLESMDYVLPWISLSVFFLAALIPAITLFNPGNVFDDKTTPLLSETELVRMRGLLGIGILASVFAPSCFAFAIRGSDWWDRVSTLYPSQRVLESSTALFALYANEASMVSHRCGKAGIAPFRTIVPVFAVVCFILAILPCAFLLYWLGGGDDISFFSFYRA